MSKQKKTTTSSAKSAKKKGVKRTTAAPLAATSATSAAPAKPKAKATKSATPRPTKQRNKGNGGALDGAAKVLAEGKKPMQCKQMVEKMLAAKLWSTSGKTPAATLSSALQREITTKGKDSRFRKIERGQFSLA